MRTSRSSPFAQRRLLGEPSGERRLPLIYLIDSILKNIGGPYFPAFYGILVEVIGSTHALLPEALRCASKMRCHKLFGIIFKIFFFYLRHSQ